ncbi:carboxypeptidase regulatory-like domain-containing protein [bacterium]|nr:carboxypeptidase regulatory-like domain-containing protein [bacterium]
MRHLSIFCLLILVMLLASPLYALTSYEAAKSEKENHDILLESLIQSYENRDQLSDEQTKLLQQSGYFFDSRESGTLDLDEVLPLFYESFEYTDLNELIAAGWTVLDGGSPGPTAPWHTWTIQTTHRGTEHVLDDTAPYIIVDSDRAGSYDMDESLVTPVLDASNFIDLVLSFDYAYKGYSAPNEQGEVLYSIDGGMAWTSLVTFTTPSTQVVQEYPYSIALPADADLSSNLQIKFRYYGANYDYWWAVDNVTVSGELLAGTLVGTVTDDETSLPVEGVAVSIDGTELSTLTDIDGYYTIPTVGQGTHSVTYLKTRYFPQTIHDIVIVLDQSTTQNVQLVPANFNLSGTVTSVGDQNIPLEGVTVESMEEGISTVTDQNGFYDFGLIGAGLHTLIVTPDNEDFTPWCHDDQVSINLVEDTALDLSLDEIMPPQALGSNQYDASTIELFWDPPANQIDTPAHLLQERIDQMLAANDRILAEGTAEELAKHAEFTRELNILISRSNQLERPSIGLDDLESNFLGYRIYIDDVLQPEIISGTSTLVNNLNTGQLYSFDVAADYGYGDEYLIPTNEPISTRPLPGTDSRWVYEEVPYGWTEISPDAGGTGTPVPNWGDDENSGWLEWGTGQSFTLYDVEETGFSICSNGWISLDRGSAGNTAIRPRIGSSSSPNLIVSLLGIDTDTGDRDCGYWWKADADNHVVVVQYQNRYYANTDPLYIYQAIFNTADNTITMSYNTAGPNSEWHGHSAIESGIENATGSEGVILPNSSISNQTSFQFSYRPSVSEWVSFQGEITNIQDGSSIEGVQVTAISIGTGLDFTAESDLNGNYQLLVDRDLEPFTITYSHEEYVESVDNDVTLLPGEFFTTHNKQLSPIGSISGTVFDQITLEPVAFAEVSAELTAGDGLWSVTADENGFYEFVRLFDRSQAYTVSANSEEHLPLDAVLVEFQEDQYAVTADIFLNPLGRITGTIYDLVTELPIPYPEVTIQPSNGEDGWMIHGDESGVFDSGSLFDRSLIYSYSASSVGYLNSSTEAIQYQETETVVTVDHSLDQLGTIFGFVVDDQDMPVGDVILTLTDNESGVETVRNSLEDGSFSFDHICNRTSSFTLNYFGEEWAEGSVNDLVFDPDSYSLGPVSVDLIPSAFDSPPTILSTNDDFDNGFLVEALPSDLFGELSSVRYDDGVVAGTAVMDSNGPNSAMAVLIDKGSPFFFLAGGFRLPVIGDGPVVPDPLYNPVIMRIHGVRPDGLPDDNILFETSPITPDESSYWVWFEPGIEIEDGRCWLSVYRLEGEGSTAICIDGALNNPGMTAAININGNWVGIPVAGDPVMEAQIYSPATEVGQPEDSGKRDRAVVSYGHVDFEIINFHPALFGKSVGVEAGPTPERIISVSDVLELDELTGMNFYYSFDGVDFLASNIDPVYDEGYFYEFSSDLENRDIYFQVTALNDIAGELIESDASEPQLITFNLAPSPVQNLLGNRVDYVVDLSWTPPVTNADGSPLVDLAGYNIYRSGELLATIQDPGTTSYQDVIDPEEVGHMYYWVTAFDEVPNESIVSLYSAGIVGEPTFTDDFESADNSGWIFMNPGETFNGVELAGDTFWEIGEPTSGPGAVVSGVNGMATNVAGHYDNNELMVAKTLSVEIFSTKAAFSYWHYFGYETGIDGYNVWASSDFGNSWENLTPLGGYPRNVTSFNAYQLDSDGYSGSTSVWQEVFVPVGDYYTGEGRSFVNLAFVHATDVSVTNVGTYVDDVSFYEAGPAWGVPLEPLHFETLLPADGAIIQEHVVTVSWTHATDPYPFETFEYTIEWSTDVDFSSINSSTTPDTFFGIEGVGEGFRSGDPIGMELMQKNSEQSLKRKLTSKGDSSRSDDNQLDDLPDDITVYWRVRATDSDGFTLWANDDSTGVSFTLDSYSPPMEFDLLRPLHGATCSSLDTTLVWNRTSDPDPYDTPHYDVWLDTLENFSTSWLVADSSADTTLAINNLLDDHTYYWTVRATDSNTSGTWSSDTLMFQTFQPEAPLAFELLAPDDGSMVQQDTVTVSWHGTSDPDPDDTFLYEVEWSTSGSFEVSYSGTTQDTFFTITDLMDAVTSGFSGNEEASSLQRLSTHSQREPRSGIRDRKLSSGSVKSTDQRGGNTRALDELPDDNTIYWRVKAVDSSGMETSASDGASWSFTVDLYQSPSLFSQLAPVNGDTLWATDATLVWSSSSDPDPYDTPHYDVWLDTLEDMSTAWLMADSLADTTFSLTSLLDIHAYYWTVRATDSNSSGTWTSDIYSFYTSISEPPLPFSLLSPDSGSVLDTLVYTFFWEETTDPDPREEVTYLLSLSLAEDFEDTMSVYYIANTNDYFPVPYLRDDSDYWWRVIASDDLGNTMISSEIWTFRTEWPESPYEFEMIGCGMLFADVADSVDVNVTWNRAWDPDPDSNELYAIHIDLDEDMANQVVLVDSISLPTTTDSLYTWTGRVATEDLPGGDGDDFYLTVHALDNNTEGTWASNVVSTHLSDVFEDPWSGMPIKYEIASLYPNPFNPTLTAVIALPKSSDLRVVVYNVMGREVAELTNRQHEAGYHSFVFNGSGLSSGIYFVHAIVPGKMNQVQKIVLIK